MAKYYSTIALDSAISLLENTEFKIGYTLNSFNDENYVVSTMGKIVYQTHSTTCLLGFCKGLVEGLNH